MFNTNGGPCHKGWIVEFIFQKKPATLVKNKLLFTTLFRTNYSLMSKLNVFKKNYLGIHLLDGFHSKSNIYHF